MESRPAPDRSSEAYDIFAGHSDKDAKWIEVVIGLKQARERMREITDERPGDYFLFNADAGLIMDRVSTIKREGVPLNLVLLNEGGSVASSKNGPQDEENAYDIFSGESDRDAIWIEAVIGIDQARARMEQIAASTPGDYFIFAHGGGIVARVHTSKHEEKKD